MTTVRALGREDLAIQSSHVRDGGPGKLREGSLSPDGTKQTKNKGTVTLSLLATMQAPGLSHIMLRTSRGFAQASSVQTYYAMTI